MTIAVVKNKGRLAEILLVEDNRGDVVLLERAFRKSQILTNIKSVPNAEQALSLLRKEGAYEAAATPDIIILDLNLPQMNGKELLQIVKTDPRLKHIPVVILSSSRAEEDVVRSYGLHANGYIVKPTSLVQFEDLVSSLEKFFFMLVMLPDSDDFYKSEISDNDSRL